MQTALHITTRVLPGNRLEVELPSGSEGKEVNVFVVLSTEEVPVLEPEPHNQHAGSHSDLASMAADPDIQTELAAIRSEETVDLEKSAIRPAPADPRTLKETSEALSRIRSRHRVNPLDFGLPDSTQMIRDDRDR